MHERSKNLCLSLSPVFASYAKKTAKDMQTEILDGRWDITEDGEFVLSARGRKIAEWEKGSGGNRKLISPGPECGVTTNEEESMEEPRAGPVGVEPQ